MTKPKPEHLKLKRGPKTKMTDKVQEEILSRIESGETLTKICEDSHIPNMSQVLRFKRKNPEFHMEYRRAREQAADLGFDRIIDLAKTFTPANAHAVRGEIDATKWWIGKVKSEYNDKIAVTGHDGGPLTLTWKVEQQGESDVIDITPSAPQLTEK